MSRTRDDLPGLQVERTLLAWDRTALALLANGALLLLRGTPERPALLLATAAALVLALAAAVLGRMRARAVRSAQPSTAPEPRAEVLLLGTGVAAFGLLLAVIAVLG